MNTSADVARIRALFEASIAVKRRLLEDEGALAVLSAMATAVADAIAAGGKLLVCGNGGSAADAQHLAAELLVRLRPNVNRPAWPAIPLAMDSSSLTACGNDYSFEAYYARMVEALGRPGDVLLGITTSGRSPNVLQALAAAQRLGIRTLGLLGGDGGSALALCELALVVPANETGRIQETHITAGHAMLELVEERLLARSAAGE